MEYYDGNDEFPLVAMLTTMGYKKVAIGPQRDGYVMLGLLDTLTDEALSVTLTREDAVTLAGTLYAVARVTQ